jgi:hypothetical protein
LTRCNELDIGVDGPCVARFASKGETRLLSIHAGQKLPDVWQHQITADEGVDTFSPSEYEALLRADFASFARHCFHELNPRAPFVPNWHHEIISRASWRRCTPAGAAG